MVVSGTAPIREGPSGAHERWGSASVTLTLDASLDGLDPDAKDAERSAFGTWVAGGTALPRLTFESSTHSREAVHDRVNVVCYGPITQPGHEQDLGVTIGYEDAVIGENSRGGHDLQLGLSLCCAPGLFAVAERRRLISRNFAMVAGDLPRVAGDHAKASRDWTKVASDLDAETR